LFAPASIFPLACVVIKVAKSDWLRSPLYSIGVLLEAGKNLRVGNPLIPNLGSISLAVASILAITMLGAFVNCDASSS